MTDSTRPTRSQFTGPAKFGTCYVCGCTEEHACEGGCWWVDETRTLCSQCAGYGQMNGTELDEGLIRDARRPRNLVDEKLDAILRKPARPA